MINKIKSAFRVVTFIAMVVVIIIALDGGNGGEFEK